MVDRCAGHDGEERRRAAAAVRRRGGPPLPLGLAESRQPERNCVAGPLVLARVVLGGRRRTRTLPLNFELVLDLLAPFLPLFTSLLVNDSL